MRFVPLIPSSFDPAPWLALGPVTLQWDGVLHGQWPQVARRGVAIHAVHLPGEAPVEEALEVLRHGLGADFLVIPVRHPETREAGFRILGHLETLLEATSGRGIKLALHLEAGSEATVLDLLHQARAEAVGFCWHPAILDAEPLADRLWCAVCEPRTDLHPLQALGYRWDMAIAATDPEAFRTQAEALGVAYPPVIFPAEMPTTMLGRPVVPDDSLVFGRHLNRDGERA
ncbi:MAG: hypothetical protein HXX12_04540 [Geothrix sp.]|uniref:hypothetical protein n=1 Tax=Geothrix sp. TaxID=1962974 RepID=UPI0017AC3F1C|nr:hypothetical protein [Geothrix sp.]NWJ40223.1 hypothetical protein [Geothrix sp.]WIL21771.1 MAG: hypothetical protein QOZ81_001042 [Geothrix sp.]